jgi:hypothetical protein
VGQRYDTWDEVIVASRTCWIGGAYNEHLGSSGPIYDTCHKLWWTMAFSMLIAPGASFFVSTIYMWSMIPLKWLLVPRITEEKMKNGETSSCLYCCSSCCCSQSMIPWNIGLSQEGESTRQAAVLSCACLT